MMCRSLGARIAAFLAVTVEFRSRSSSTNRKPLRPGARRQLDSAPAFDTLARRSEGIRAAIVGCERGAMETKDILQLAVSAVVPFIAAAGAVWLSSLQRKERISCTLTFGFGGPEHGERTFLSVHNYGDKMVAISRINYVEGIVFRRRQVKTALEFEDPDDLDFPYPVDPDKIRHFMLEELYAKRIAEAVTAPRALLARILRRPRLLVECETTRGTKARIAAEQVLPWKDQATWTRAKL